MHGRSWSPITKADYDQRVASLEAELLKLAKVAEAEEKQRIADEAEAGAKEAIATAERLNA